MGLTISGMSSWRYSLLPQETEEKLRKMEEETARLMRYIDENTETAEERRARIEAQKKESKKLQEKKKKINKLNGDIAYYRSRLMMNPDDDAARGALAMAKCQRYWANVD